MIAYPARFELKYIIDEARARAVRQFVECYLPVDPHVGEARGYRVCSVYLDSPGFELYRQTATGHRDRFKLRIRYYNDDCHRAKLEVKRRSQSVITKEVARINGEGAGRVIDSHWPDASHLGWNGSQPREHLQREVRSMRVFCQLRERIGATGRVRVDYWREAYESPQRYSPRITFDRRLCTEHFRAEEGWAHVPATTVAGVGGVILEVKFHTPRPLWLGRMVQQFGLRRCSVPKYAICVDELRRLVGERSRA